MATFGQELKKHRESRGISLEEIADATKINLRYLRALEEDQLDILPGKFFTRGILRTFAKYIGLDEDDILTWVSEPDKFKEYTQEDIPQEELDLEPPEKTRNILPYPAIAAFLAVVFIIFYFAFIKQPSITSVKLPAYRQVQEAEILLPSVESFQDTELNLVIIFHKRTWIQVYADRKRRLHSLQQPGEQFQLTAQESLLITVGNAEGISYTINGKKGRPLGSSGEVVRDVYITLKNYKEFQTR